MDDNVLRMPTPLERLAGLINQDLQHCYSGIVKTDEGRRQWKDGAYNLCLHLAEAKGHYPALIEFGQWCDANGFGENIIDHQTRAAAITMAKHPEALRACLEVTKRKSLRTIHDIEFSRFTNSGKTPRRKEKPARLQTPSPKIDAARDAVREFVEANKPVNRDKIGEQTGISPHTIQKAVLFEKGRLEGLREAEEAKIDALPIAEMQPTTKRRYEAALRKARNELREEITAEVSAAYQLMIERTRERVVRADRIIASHQGVMSRGAFRKIKACLHPDHNTFTFAAEALQIFSELERVLVKAEDTAPVASGLPKTAAEMMARRRASKVS